MKNGGTVLISWTAVLLWMMLIFHLSSQVAVQSDALSRGILGIVMGAIEAACSGVDFDINLLNHLLRKCAHFLSYLILGGLVINALRNNRLQGFQWLLAALAICVLYAASDEFHQLFVPGRGGQVIDVFIDSSGSFVGIGLYEAVRKSMR